MTIEYSSSNLNITDQLTTTKEKSEISLMKHLILALSILFSFSVQADNLILGQATYHYKKYQSYYGDEFVNNRVLVGYSTKDYTLAVMDQNSYGHVSAVLVKTKEHSFNKYFRGILSYGVATGYAKEIPELSLLGLTPTAYLSLDTHLANDKIGLVTTINQSFIGIGLRIKIN